MFIGTRAVHFVLYIQREGIEKIRGGKLLVFSFFPCTLYHKFITRHSCHTMQPMLEIDSDFIDKVNDEMVGSNN